RASCWRYRRHPARARHDRGARARERRASRPGGAALTVVFPRGAVDAAAFVLDVPTLGEMQCRRRVLALWEPGSRLCELPDGRWLLLLPQSRTVRAERAPGLPVQGADDRYVELRHGTTVVHELSSLRAVDPSAWLDTSALATVQVTALS